MEGQTLKLLGYSWTFLPGLVFSILTFFRLRNKNERGSFQSSLITFVLSLFLIAFSIFCLVGVSEIILLLIAGLSFSAAFVLCFVSANFRSSLEHLVFQKLRDIILYTLGILYVIIILLMFGKTVSVDIKSGMILGISNAKAIEAAEKELNPGVKYEPCRIAEKEDIYENGSEAPIRVICGVYFGNTDNHFMDREVLISARSGQVMYLDDEHKVRITISKDGKPLANTHVFSGRMEDALTGRGGDFVDYGVTDSNGEVSLLITSGYTNRIYTLDYKYIDLLQGTGQSLNLNWNEAKQLPKDRMLFQINSATTSAITTGDTIQNSNTNSNQDTSSVRTGQIFTGTGPITNFYFDPDAREMTDSTTGRPTGPNVIYFQIPENTQSQVAVINKSTLYEHSGKSLTASEAEALFVKGSSVTVTYRALDENLHYLATKIVFN